MPSASFGLRPGFLLLSPLNPLRAAFGGGFDGGLRLGGGISSAAFLISYLLVNAFEFLRKLDRDALETPARARDAVRIWRAHRFSPLSVVMHQEWDGSVIL